MKWLVPIDNDQYEQYTNPIRNAYTLAYNRGSIDRYRSRTEVTEEDLWTAFSWLGLAHYKDGIKTPHSGRFHYKQKAVQRGVTAEEAVNALKDLVTYTGDWGCSDMNILSINTATNAEGATALKTYIESEGTYEELNVRPMITVNTNHKIHIYRRIVNEDTPQYLRNYIVLNNQDTAEIVFKISAAILLTEAFFEEDTKPIADMYLAGNGKALNEYMDTKYKEYTATAKKRQKAEALELLADNISKTETEKFQKRISDAEENVAYTESKLQEAYHVLNKAKADCLLFITTNTNEAAAELKAFIESCVDTVTYIKTSTDGKYLDIVYRTPLMYYEAEKMQMYFNATRPNSVLRASEEIQQLLKDVFINQTHEILIESGVRFNLRDADVQYVDPVILENIEGTTVGIPNPHHKYYNCWGDNRSKIIRALENKRYTEAVLQAFAAMAGLNLTDTAVVDRMITEELNGYARTKYIKVKETNEVLTLEEYKERLANASSETN